MKKIPLLLGLIITIFSCNSYEQLNKDNVELISNYVKAVENLDFDAMDSYLADNYLGLGPSYGDTIGKVQAIESWKNNVETLYESIKYDRSRNIAIRVTEGDNQGDWVSNWAELNIHYKNQRGSVKIWANSIYQIENGKIVKSYTFYNEADALEQLGYVFINPNEL